jgi:hypothetical protein
MSLKMPNSSESTLLIPQGPEARTCGSAALKSLRPDRVLPNPGPAISKPPQRGLSVLVLVVSVVLTSLLVNCSRYEIKEDKQGRAIRVDRWTGDIQIVQGNKVITPDKAPTAQEIQSLAQPRALGERTLSQFESVKAILTTSWREDKLYYRFSIEPYPEKMLGSISGLSLVLHDKAGFKLMEIDLLESVAGGGVRGIVDNSGKRTELLFNHFVGCSREIYISVTSWSIGWRSK